MDPLVGITIKILFTYIVDVFIIVKHITVMIKPDDTSNQE